MPDRVPLPLLLIFAHHLCARSISTIGRNERVISNAVSTSSNVEHPVNRTALLLFSSHLGRILPPPQRVTSFRAARSSRASCNKKAVYLQPSPNTDDHYCILHLLLATFHPAERENRLPLDRVEGVCLWHLNASKEKSNSNTHGCVEFFHLHILAA